MTRIGAYREEYLGQQYYSAVDYGALVGSLGQVQREVDRMRSVTLGNCMVHCCNCQDGASSSLIDTPSFHFSFYICVFLKISPLYQLECCFLLGRGSILIPKFLRVPPLLIS